jgi:hypothetical protein
VDLPDIVIPTKDDTSGAKWADVRGVMTDLQVAQLLRDGGMVDKGDLNKALKIALITTNGSMDVAYKEGVQVGLWGFNPANYPDLDLTSAFGQRAALFRRVTKDGGFTKDGAWGYYYADPAWDNDEANARAQTAVALLQEF